MRTESVTTKLSQEENAVFNVVLADNPMVKKASMASMLILLGALTYWKRKAAHDQTPLDPLLVLAEVQAEVKKLHPTTQKKTNK